MSCIIFLKIVQRAVADILEAIFEQDFIEESYGYRQTAVTELGDEGSNNETI